MEDLKGLLERADSLSKANELAAELADVLTSLKPRRGLRSTTCGNDAYDTAVKKGCALEDLLSDNLRIVSERRNVAVSPIYRLNDDVWRMVLLSLHKSNASSRDRLYTSLRISQVSRRWRQVSLDTAELWSDRGSDISGIGPGPDDFDDPPWRMTPRVRRERRWRQEMVSELSRRSKGALLEMALEPSRIDASLYPTSEEFGRTKALSVHVNRVQDATRLLEACPDSMELLNTLRMSVRTSPNALPTEWDNFSRLLSTKVTHVRILSVSTTSLSDIFSNRSRCETLLRFCESLSVRVVELSPSSLVNICQTSPHLRTFSIMAMMDPLQPTEVSSTGTSSYGRTGLPALEELEITMPGEVIGIVLNLVKAPSLRTLHLHSTGPVTEHMEATWQFLRSSTPPLLHLSSAMDFSHDRCRAILACIPTLNSLSILPRAPDVAIFDVLTPSLAVGETALCPALEILQYGWQPTQQTLSSILAMVRARLSLHESNPLDVRLLRSLVLLGYAVPEDERPMLEELASLLGERLSVGGWKWDTKTKAWNYHRTEILPFGY